VPRALPLDADLPDEVQKGEQALSHAESLGQGATAIVETEILQARTVGAAIVDEAVERRADLIVMAAQYRRRLGEFNLGLTLPYVLKNAPCRVLVARAPSPVEVSTPQPVTNGQRQVSGVAVH
jgi:nucleotide-binding universal stress UspA family protein